MRFLLSLGLAAALALPAAAHEFSVGDLTIGHPHAAATPPGARTGAGYFSVTNAGTEPDRLIAVEADFPRVEQALQSGRRDRPGIPAREPQPGAIVVLGVQLVSGLQPGRRPATTLAGLSSNEQR